MTVEAIGPFTPCYRFTVDGYTVPNLTGYLVDGETTWSLVYDQGIGITCPNDQLHQLVWFIANVAAINAGFTCHGENSRPRNPHRVQSMKIGEIITEENGTPPDEADMWDQWGQQ